MSILLTDTEKAGILGWCSREGNKKKGWHIIVDETATAQLKKIANWLENLPTDGHDKWYWYHQDLAKQLLRECE